ncbi:hypothetical protein K1719_012235 [Acacia pycnantha]|nr:hypothetical protein K1719_012235 [Acacia pycnantha]
MEVGDCYEGRKLIKRRLCNKKVLLVLDDVSDISQLENLAGKEGWFAKGSRIIMTTRDQHLLVQYGVSQYKMNILSEAESYQLFLQKTFKGAEPNEDYLELSNIVVKSAEGLPLALEVFGSFLCGRSKSEWADALGKVPPNGILEILKVSFDGLKYNEKTIFLDLTCFFNGWQKKIVMQFLESSGLYPEIRVKVLIEKSLVTENKGCLRVHDMLQEMGKEIVFSESFDDAGKRSRIWCLEDANHVPGNKRGTKAIRGIVVRFNLTNHFLPSQTQFNELIDLQMQHSKLKELWRGTQFLQSLKFIDLSHSTNLIRTPNFNTTPNLQELILEGCTKLIEVHHSLGQHKNLVIVNFKDCKSIKTLPTKFEMNCLETFVLSGCSNVRKLPKFGKGLISKLQKLEFLSFFDCPTLKSLPQLPSNLSTIHAGACPLLKHYVRSQLLWEFIEQFESQTQVRQTEYSFHGWKQHFLRDYMSSIISWDSQITDFFMQPTRLLVISGSEVPSWFHNQNYFCAEDFSYALHPPTNVSFIVNEPDSFCLSEWWGIAVCLVLENDLESANLEASAVFWAYRVSKGRYSNSVRGCHIQVVPSYCHQLCIIYIRFSSFLAKQLQLVFFPSPEESQNNPAFKIGKCGWRVLSKEDIERWQDTRDEDNNDEFIVKEDESISGQ